MNYIKHLSGFFEKAGSDFDLNPTHISLYMALFQLWNQNRFRNPIAISRDELMRISKIASYATYHKCLRELDEREFVHYMPSYNPFKGSTLEVVPLEFYSPPLPQKRTERSKSLKNGRPKNEPVVEQGIEPVNELPVNPHCTGAELLPYINNTNSINLVNGQALPAPIKNDGCLAKTEDAATPLLAEKKGRGLAGEIPPAWEAVLPYFREKNKSEIEAQKFYNHFESNGWLVGGKSKMKNWPAAARNWMLNADRFGTKSTLPQPNHLQTPNTKNYDEPL